MGFPLELSIRYIRSRKRAFIAVGTLFAILGVLLGVAALTTVVSVTGGFFKEFQDKVLGVNAHVLVLKYASDFREYRDVMKVAEKVPGVRGVAPFFINPMMVTHGRYTATGVLLKGIDPERVNQVLDLPKHIIEGNLDGLRVKDSKPPSRRSDPFYDGVTLGVTNERGGVTILPSNSAEPMQRSAPTAASTAVKKAGPSVAAPEGDVEPEGGYQSVLPDEDVIPSDIWTDPCHSPDKIASLPGIAVGKTLRENLHLSLGDCMQITFPTVGFSY